jgi:hypothetical protein
MLLSLVLTAVGGVPPGEAELRGRAGVVAYGRASLDQLGWRGHQSSGADVVVVFVERRVAAAALVVAERVGLGGDA